MRWQCWQTFLFFLSYFFSSFLRHSCLLKAISASSSVYLSDFMGHVYYLCILADILRTLMEPGKGEHWKVGDIPLN